MLFMVAIMLAITFVVLDKAFAKKPFTSTSVACTVDWASITQPATDGSAKLVVSAQCKGQRFFTFTLKPDGTVVDQFNKPVGGQSTTLVKSALAKITLLDTDLDLLSGMLASVNAVDP